MSLLQTIKTDSLEARKARKAKTATALTTLIGELETFGKNAGREPTDEDVVAFVKKTLKNIDETLKALHENDDRQVDLLHEKALFEKYLPKQLSEVELRTAIDDTIKNWNADRLSVGDVMRVLKTKYNGQYDGALASSILKEMFAK